MESHQANELDSKTSENLDSLTIAHLESRQAQKTLNSANLFWSSTDCNQRLTIDNIKVSLNPETRRYVGVIDCLMCEHKVSLSSTSYTLALHNYKRHITSSHINLKIEKAKPKDVRILFKQQEEKKRRIDDLDGDEIDLTNEKGKKVHFC